MVIIAITGHRPEKIDDEFNVKSALFDGLKDLHATHVIQGMASGVDLWSAQVAYKLGIPYTCARPWAGHRPRVVDKDLYEKVLAHAYNVVNITLDLDYPGPWVYQERNKWMIDRAYGLLAIWDGSPGGTKNAYDYAMRKQVPILRYNPINREWTSHS